MANKTHNQKLSMCIRLNRTELNRRDKVNWKHGHTEPVMCNRKIGVWKQTGAFVSNRNKKRQQHAQNDSTKQKNDTIRK